MAYRLMRSLKVSVQGASPRELATKGAGLQLLTGLWPTPCGDLYVAWAPCGLAYAAFAGVGGNWAVAQQRLKQLWPMAQLKRDDAGTKKRMRAASKLGLKCWVPGTAFQMQVWRTLLKFPLGSRSSYRSLAVKAGVKGPRAVGQAVGANRVALFIPCHRVVRADGSLGGYRWGSARKRALLAVEERRVSSRLRSIR